MQKSPDEEEGQEFNTMDFRGEELEILSSDVNDERTDPPEIRRRPVSKLSRKLRSKITTLEIPTKPDATEILRPEDESGFITCRPHTSDESSTDDGYETAEESLLTEEDFMVPKANLFDDECQDEEGHNLVLKEQILHRINSHKSMRSYQLGKQLSSRWSTGAGPRIGCMRDYPSELRLSIMEQANLSPRHKPVNSAFKEISRFAPVASTPADFFF